MLFSEECTNSLVANLNAIRDSALSAPTASPAWWAFVFGRNGVKPSEITSPAPGVVISDDGNLNNLINALVKALREPGDPEEEFVDPSLVDPRPRGNSYVATYCVCDNHEQVLTYWRARIEDPARTYCILMTPIHRQPGNTGGWRWHKWGDYIGTQRPQCEYLDDEPEIEMIYTASIYELRAEGISATSERTREAPARRAAPDALRAVVAHTGHSTPTAICSGAAKHTLTTIEGAADVS